MLRKKSIYRKELITYMYISDLCIKFERIDILHRWCKDLMTSFLTSILIKLDWINQDWDWDWASFNQYVINMLKLIMYWLKLN